MTTPWGRDPVPKNCWPLHPFWENKEICWWIRSLCLYCRCEHILNFIYTQQTCMCIFDTVNCLREGFWKKKKRQLVENELPVKAVTILCFSKCLMAPKLLELACTCCTVFYSTWGGSLFLGDTFLMRCDASFSIHTFSNWPMPKNIKAIRMILAAQSSEQP